MQPRGPWLSGIAAILVFALAGPLIGGLVAWLTMGLPNLVSPVPFILGAWQEGGPIALGTGIIAASALWRGYRSWLVPIIAALVASAAFILPTTAVPSLPRVAFALLPPALAAAIACWWLTRRLTGR